jgi:cytochrome c peroxidase
MSTRVPRLWLIFACAGTGAAALAQPAGAPPVGAHGAAAMEVQQAELDRLGVSRDGTLIPASVDANALRSMIPADNALDEKRIALGRKLYFETALSNDGSVACATCHDTTRSFTDRRPVSEGFGSQLGRRNAPTTMNAALLQSQFWDGREGTLEQQAGQPILNPVEMAMPSREAAVEKLKAAGYEADFQAAYNSGVTYENIERAIASFERTLLFMDAPFDRFIAGEREAISNEARAGFVLFNGKARCVTCHTINRANPLGTDNRFHNIGVSARKQDFESLAKKALAALAEDSSKKKLDELAIGTDLSELGRFMVSKSYADIGAFRTPQLRNIGITGPYMHDGSMQTLWDTIDHYNKGGEANPFLDGGMEALALNDAEIDQLIEFMFTLTDKRFEAFSGSEHARQRALALKQRPFRDDAIAQRKQLDFEKRALGGALGAPPDATGGGK